MRSLSPRSLASHRRLLAPVQSWLSQRLDSSYELTDLALSSWKVCLFSEAHGVVLEIGAGAGINRKYLRNATAYLALEPRPAACQQLAAIGERALCARAEHVPLASASVDCVVCSTTLCSVGDPGTALAEVVRVLRPGGHFFVIEHVCARRRTWLRAWQRLLSPASQRLERGCRPDRDTGAALRASRLVMDECREFQMRLRAPLIRDWIVASLVKPHSVGVS